MLRAVSVQVCPRPLRAGRLRGAAPADLYSAGFQPWGRSSWVFRPCGPHFANALPHRLRKELRLGKPDKGFAPRTIGFSSILSWRLRHILMTLRSSNLATKSRFAVSDFLSDIGKVSKGLHINRGISTKYPDMHVPFRHFPDVGEKI